MRHLDLFSGIGGFALAASWVWPGHEVVAFCDIDPYATKVLNRHWPDVPVINDVRNITKDTIDGPIHLITGGFPCQPFSQAGKRKGKDDDRYLWPEMLRIITELSPQFVLGENVSGIASIDDGMVFDQVCTDLERAGYEVWPIRVPASALNAPHRRDRWWFAAYRNSDGPDRSHGEHGEQSSQGRQYAQHDAAKDGNAADAEDAADSQREQRGGGRCAQQYTDPRGAFCQSERDNGHDLRGKAELRNTRAAKYDGWNRHWLEAAAEFCRVDDGLSDRMDTRDRKHRLKALGNAIVPQVAAQIMQAMKEADNPTPNQLTK